MQIGVLLRNIVVEPLELWCKSRHANLSLFLCQNQNLNRCQSLSEQSRLHLARRRLPRLAVERVGLKSLNGEPWLPGRPLAAECRAAALGTIVGRAKAVHGAPELRIRTALAASTQRRTLSTCASSGTRCAVSTAKSISGAQSWSTNLGGVPGLLIRRVCSGRLTRPHSH
jgi:hypothetical protein